MDAAGLNDRIAAAAMAIDPEATLRRVWPLLGGSAAQVLACEVVLADGQVRKYLLEYCDGQPDLAPADVPGHLLQYATALANLHQLDWRSLNLPFLPTLDLAAT